MSGTSGIETDANVINTSLVTNPAPRSVYQTQRFATKLTYVVPKLAPGGSYSVRLHFVESYFQAPSKRIFSVSINGDQVLTNYDIFKAAGGANVAIAPTFAAQANAAGQIIIVLSASVNNASLAALEVTEASSATPAPSVQIDAGGASNDGAWVADTDYSMSTWGGVASVTSAINTSLVANPAPQSVYQSQRWASTITYTIPNLTAGANYNVLLHLVESYWTAAGKRLFNVTINGVQVLTNFDIFAAAGGQNIALIKQFSTSASSTGIITITLTATSDTASIAGLEVIPQSTSTPSPSPSPSPTPVATGNALPWVYTELWSSTGPMRMTVAQQKALGAAVLPHTYMDSLWSQGIANNGTAAQIPIYVARASDPLLKTSCRLYGGGCDAAGVQIHVPSYAVPQSCSGACSDDHLTVIDQNAPSGPIEIDCWQTQLSAGTLSCSWAGVFQLGGLGNDNGGEGVHFGRPISSYFVTGQEILNGHIDHPLGINAVCLNNPNVYPAQTMAGTDGACAGGGSNPPHYGNLVHLLWSPAKIASSAYSAPCKTILTALATYGAYLDDTGNNGNQIRVENELSYTSNPLTASLDPWPGIQSQLNAAGDGSGSNWASCLNRLASSDFEMLQDTQP